MEKGTRAPQLADADADDTPKNCEKNQVCVFLS